MGIANPTVRSSSAWDETDNHPMARIVFRDPDQLRKFALELLALADSPVADQIRAHAYKEAVKTHA